VLTLQVPPFAVHVAVEGAHAPLAQLKEQQSVLTLQPAPSAAQAAGDGAHVPRLQLNEQQSLPRVHAAPFAVHAHVPVPVPPEVSHLPEQQLALITQPRPF
jgi:hypothetical protein